MALKAYAQIKRGFFAFCFTISTEKSTAGPRLPQKFTVQTLALRPPVSNGWIESLNYNAGQEKNLSKGGSYIQQSRPIKNK